MFYAGHDEGQLCKVTTPAARRIGGVVFCAGSHWIRPEFRGRRLSHLLARLGRDYAMARWPIEWAIALVAPVLVVCNERIGSSVAVGTGAAERPPDPLRSDRGTFTRTASG